MEFPFGVPMTIAEVARAKDRSEDTVRRWFDAGKLTGVRTASGLRLIDPASLVNVVGGRRRRGRRNRTA